MSKNTEKITIKIEGAEWEKALDKSFKKNVLEKKVDGFRKGAVPKDIYIKRFGIESLYPLALENVVDDAYSKAFEQKKVEPQVQPAMNILEVNEKGATFEFTFVGKPDVKLGAYKDLKIKKEKVKVTEEDISEEINHLRDEFAEIRVKDEGSVAEKDTAVIDFEGKVDGKVIDGGTGANYPLEIGSHTFIPGFEEAIVGMNIGEEKDIPLRFPENYVKDLAGKDVVFHVKLNEIKTRVLPEINEDFFKDLGYEKVTNETELKDEVKKVLEERKQKEIDDKFLDDVLENAASKMEIDLPEEIIDDEIHRMIHQFEEQLKMQGLTIDQYYEFTKTTHEDMHKNMEPEAIKRLKYRYLLEEVAEKEKIEVTDEEAEKDCMEMAQNYGITKEELLDAFGGMDVMKYDAKMRKTLEFLKNNN